MEHFPLVRQQAFGGIWVVYVGLVVYGWFVGHGGLVVYGWFGGVGHGFTRSTLREVSGFISMLVLMPTAVVHASLDLFLPLFLHPLP